ncbi:MAG: AmmeMemoRadiSam system protein B [Verrucomicrobium sp.]|nr:AmmeMemoRadiSam system protein B [Verrucomicrobium sp.]
MIGARCAGTCYPTEPEAALDYFRAFFGGADGAPWEPDAEKDLPPPRAIVTPHIDFRVSPRAYGHAFAPWLRRPAEADVYLILGVGHRASLPWSLDARPYRTPLGTVQVEKALGEEIAAACPFPLADLEAHVGEHSIEFPLVLLQALRKLRGIERPFTFLPVLCGGLFPEVAAGKPPGPQSHSARFARAVGEAAARYGRRLQTIVSIDGCHVGPRFEHPFPVDQKILKDCAVWEELLWRHVEARDLNGFFAHLGQDGNARYFDGVGALTLLMQMPGEFRLARTHYEQWFAAQDASVVTFTSGWVQ